MNRPRSTATGNTPLANTSLEVNITDLVAEYVVRHRFENRGTEAIEAVFSFPVPLDAAFLSMRATIAGETLIAEIQPQRQASRTYDDAITEGHSAVLLSAPEPGLLCTSLGNLKPGETGEIELRFVTPLLVADRTARFSLPLVHRPRYGKWQLEDLETPTHNFAVEHPMSATIRVEGLLASAPVSCAAHAARFAKKGEHLELSISQAMLDRDLVLIFELAQDIAPVARLIGDGDATLGLASFVLPTRLEPPKPLDLCLVLDGSGSMSGDAIHQSRQAAAALIDAIGDQDRVQILRFGSSIVPMFRRPLLATLRVREAMRELIPTIESDLGGTEMGKALEFALDQLGPPDETRSRAVILVTDGAVQSLDIASAQKAAEDAAVRIFVVAVGSSAGAEVLGPLAEATGAVLERAVPAEPIDACVMRQFRRARESGAVEISVYWPDQDEGPIFMGNHYPGDAVNVAAALPSPSAGDVLIEAPSLDFSLRIPLGSRIAAPALRALLGQQLYRLTQPSEREAIALRYGLLTEHTSAVLVKIRAGGDKVDGLPTIIHVPQMVPEGMVGSAMAAHAAGPPMVFRSMSHQVLDATDDRYLDIPAFSRRLAKNKLTEPTEAKAAAVAMEISTDLTTSIFVDLYRRLRDASHGGLPPHFPTLRQLVDEMPSDKQEQACFLIRKCGLQLDDSFASIRLFLVLNTALGEPALSDELEAMLAVAIASGGKRKAEAAAKSIGADSTLSRKVRRFLHEGLNATDTGDVR